MPHQQRNTTTTTKNNNSMVNNEAMERQRQFEMFQESLPKVNRILFQMILNEIVPLSVRVENQLTKMNSFEDEAKSNNIGSASSSQRDSNLNEINRLKDLSINDNSNSEIDSTNISQSDDVLIHKLSQLIDEDENKYNNILKRIRDIGIKIGFKLTNLLIFTNNVNLNFKEMDLLLIMKFICRDVWKHVFGKQIDNLKTNHRGTFYLTDYDYPLLQSFCIETNTIPSQLNEELIIKKELKLVEPFLELPVGIIKGTLLSLGYPLDEVICLATFIDKPKERIKNSFPKGISFHVQITKPFLPPPLPQQQQ